VAVFPQGKTRVRDRAANAGERRVLEALARHLEDDYTVWHNIPILGSGHEPDFVLLHPQRGLLILEVKDWKRQTLAEANPMRVTLRTERGHVSTMNPLSQARNYAVALHVLLERQPLLRHADGPHRNKLVLPWGFGAVLSHIKRSEVAGDASFFDVFEPHKVLLWDDLQEGVDPLAFQERLWGMFQVAWPARLTLPQMNLVRGLVFPELRIGAPAAAAAATSSALVVRDVLQVMDLHQESVARGLGEGHRVIHGPAGSGKTMILIFRAMQLQAQATPDKPVLVLCFNRLLAERIASLLQLKGAGPAVQVSTFHAWAMDLIRTYQLGPVRSGALTSEDYDAFARLACEGITAGRVPLGQYAAILIDEAHDLADDWLAAAARMVDPATRSLLVLYDDAQSIYQKSRRRLNFAKLGIEARGRTEILKINYRNTTEVLSLAVECAGAILQDGQAADAEAMPLVLPQSAGRRGPMPALRRFGNGRDEALAIAATIVEALAQGRSPAEFAVLARHRKALETIRAELEAAGVPCAAERRQRGVASPPGVTLGTLHGSKGLEFADVFVAELEGLSAGASDRVEELRLLYVAMTRATHALHLSAVGDSPIVQHVEAALQRLQLPA
jgi:hypothetical protein